VPSGNNQGCSSSTFLPPLPPSVPISLDDGFPFSEIKDVLHICAVETDANRPLFKHWLG
jgi:hypothetical protein